MTDLPLIFVNGLLGSSHCVGMCGGFALAIGLRAEQAGSNLRRQFVYTAGRIITYSFCGALAGAIGQRLSSRVPSLIHLQSILALAAGLLLVWQGLRSAGFRWGMRRPLSTAPCLAGGVLKTFLTAPELTNVFLAGLMTGFLPCGLVYAHLALASASADIGKGLLVMATLGAGTAPLMVATGLGGNFLSYAVRRRLLTCAAWCVVATGVLSMGRGAATFVVPRQPDSPACPFCRPNSLTADSAVPPQSVP